MSDAYEPYSEPVSEPFYSEEPAVEASPIEGEQAEISEEYELMVERYDEAEEDYSGSSGGEIEYEDAGRYDPTLVTDEGRTSSEERPVDGAEERAALIADREEVAEARRMSADNEATSAAYLREDNAFDDTLTDSG